MGGFLQALSALAPVAPAMSDARDLRTARDQQQQAFASDQALKEAQLTAQKLAAQAEQQRLRAGNQPIFLPGSKPEFNPVSGTYQQPAWIPEKGAPELVDVPGISPEQTAKYKLDSFNKNRAAAAELMPNATPAQLDYTAAVLSGIPAEKPLQLTPYQSLEFNQPKLSMTGGLPTVTFQGKSYTAPDLKDPNTPAEVKKLLQNGADALKQKQSDEDRRQQLAMDRLAATMAHQSELQTQRVVDALHTNDYEKAQQEVRKAQSSFDLSRNLYSRMQAAEQKALAGDQQAMFSILSNHIVMTTRQAGSSMRPSKPLFDEAVSSLPAADNLMKRFDENKGLLLGIVLTPDQIQQMVDLGKERVAADQQTLGQIKSAYADALGWGQQMENGGGGGRPAKGKRGTATAAPASTSGGFDWNSAPVHNSGGPQ